MNTLYLAPTVSPSDSVPTSTTALFATASDSSTMSSPLPTIHRSLTCPSAIPPLSSHPTPVFKYDDVGMSRTANHTWQEPQSTDNSGAINEKNIDVPDTSVAVVWPPWKRRDGWSGWMGDTVTADSLVWSLIIQAFSTGILDATTSLDFSTFASNRESYDLRIDKASNAKQKRVTQFFLPLLLFDCPAIYFFSLVYRSPVSLVVLWYSGILDIYSV